MAIRSILISSGSSKRWMIPSNKFTYDTNTKYVSIDNISSSQFVLTGAVSGVLISSGGIISVYKASDYSGSYLISDSNKWTVGSAENASIGFVSGTLSGSYPNPKFVDISYVNTGSLPIARGGFSGSNNYNLLSSIPSGSLILASGTGSLTVVSTASFNGTGDWVLASVSGTSIWAAVTASAPARDVNVQYFTCSAPLTITTASWTKLNQNHQWARIMLQGGGGGGGGSPGGTAFASSGGGAGGFTDAVIYIGNVSSATITIGAGTTGSNTTNIRANTAASSSFSASNIFLSAGGGQGGIYGPASNTAPGGVGGIGLTYNGGDGGSQTVAPATPANATLSAIGSSGGGVQTQPGGIAGLYTLNIAGGTTGVIGSGSSNIYGYNIPVGFGSGGGGATTASAKGGNGVSGSGGGAGARGTGGTGGPGGDGGDGWVVVVSY